MAKEICSPTVEEIAALLKCVTGNESAAYVSVPITTGKRFLEWYKDRGRLLKNTEYSEAHFREVIKPNMDDAQEFISHIRATHECIVIEPTALTIDCWSQNDYNKFWKTVIERYISKVYFGDGWYLSKGCTMEFMVAFKKGIPTYKQNKKHLTAKEALDLIQTGIGEYNLLGLDASFQNKMADELKRAVQP